MSYYGVLGYSSNPMIGEYQEQYFQKLLSIVKGFVDIEERFFNLSINEQKFFLLLPDISSLLMDFYYKQSQESLKIFKDELDVFLDGHLQNLTSQSGKKIHGTNIYLTLDDNNPENTIVGHPGHDQDGMLGWGEKTPEEWNKVFSKSFALLKEINQDFYDELNYIIKKIVPMKTSIDAHNSCSYKECIGTLYLGYTINVQYPELSILEALIHESSHNKLNLIMQSEKLTLNDYELKYYSPYRPDARHIHGVYLGVHAIVPTVYVLLQAIKSGYITDKQWQQKVLLYHMKNKLGYKVLQKYALTTKVGRNILNDIRDVIVLSDQILENLDIMSDINKSEILHRAKHHFNDVKTNYPYLQY